MAPKKFSAMTSFLDDDEGDSIHHSDHDEPNPSHAPKMSTADMKEQPKVPVHPVPAFQAPFAESMVEASKAPQNPQRTLKTASERRKALLEQESHEETHVLRWKRRSGQQFHELWKLMSQISFGVYLLLNGIAKDDEQVLQILQGHVDDVDQFLEMTLDDFDLAQKDIEERLKLLKVPLENIHVFETMLVQREFQLQIVTGNERIEHIRTRTASAMNDTLKDVEQGIKATRQFIMYLTEEDNDSNWKEEQPEMIRVFDAMKGNANGWHRAFALLQTKGEHLGASLEHLGSIVHEMSRRAGEVSRRQRFGNDRSSGATLSPPASPPRHSHRHDHKTHPTKNNSIIPKPLETLPATRYGERHQPISENRAQRAEKRSQAEQPQVITLKPTTYTPTPSPSPSRTPVPREDSPERKGSHPPQVETRNFLQHRISLRQSSTKSTTEVERFEPPPPIRATLSTPPASGRGPDSAYCSDTEKFYLSGGISKSAYDAFPSPSQNLQPPFARLVHHQSTPRPDTEGSHTPPGSPGTVSESRTHLRPVNANPNSPLQRPWTAAPDDRRAPPSRMGMSTMSEMSSMSAANTITPGKPPKKKKSAFNWFKKAFSLSEEERATFEARRRAPDPRPEERMQPLFLDGKRIRDGHAVQYCGREGTLMRASSRAPTRDGPPTRQSTRPNTGF